MTKYTLSTWHFSSHDDALVFIRHDFSISKANVSYCLRPADAGFDKDKSLPLLTKHECCPPIHSRPPCPPGVCRSRPVVIFVVIIMETHRLQTCSMLLCRPPIPKLPFYNETDYSRAISPSSESQLSRRCPLQPHPFSARITYRNFATTRCMPSRVQVLPATGLPSYRPVRSLEARYVRHFASSTRDCEDQARSSHDLSRQRQQKTAASRPRNELSAWHKGILCSRRSKSFTRGRIWDNHVVVGQESKGKQEVDPAGKLHRHE